MQTLEFDYSSRLRSQQIAIGGCLPAVHSHSRTNSARLVVYATKKSAEMPRQTYQQRRDRFRKASTCLRRSCASFVFVYRRRALLIPAYMTGCLVSRWNEEQATGIKAPARRSIQVNCSVQEKRVDRAELAGSGALRDTRSTAS